MENSKNSTELIKKLGVNKYQLVILLSKRARELMFGAKSLIDNNDSDFIETAIKEVLEGKVKLQI